MINRKLDFKSSRLEFLIENTWKEILSEELNKPYFENLKTFVTEEYSNETIFPPKFLIFNALNICPFEKLKVVILGQDPYHNVGQAHGLAFSVPDSIERPPSLKNIFKELENDLEIKISEGKNNLEKWAKQGVLLLNSILTVRIHEPMSHSSIGWTIFTDRIIRKISEKKDKIVFLLWGKPAQQKINLIDDNKHFILTAAHPSPLSASKGFFGCKHFSKTNNLLQEPIDWNL